MTPQSVKPGPAHQLGAALASLLLALLVGGLGGLATASSVTTWYAALEKPALTPPNGVFGPVWTTLYILMAVAAWRVWRTDRADPRRRRALILYAVQLTLNLAWSVIFFGLRQPGLALIELAVLLLLVVLCTLSFWRIDRTAGYLLSPYALWVTFAGWLNLEVWRLN